VKFLIVFLFFSIGLSAAMRLAGVLLDAVFFGTYGRADVARLSMLALIEPLIYRPALLWPRLYAFYEFATGHKAHESLTRVSSGGETPSPGGG
jgi:hypothetical protein